VLQKNRSSLERITEPKEVSLYHYLNGSRVILIHRTIPVDFGFIHDAFKNSTGDTTGDFWRSIALKRGSYRKGKSTVLFAHPDPGFNLSVSLFVSLSFHFIKLGDMRSSLPLVPT